MATLDDHSRYANELAAEAQTKRDSIIAIAAMIMAAAYGKLAEASLETRTKGRKVDLRFAFEDDEGLLSVATPCCTVSAQWSAESPGAVRITGTVMMQNLAREQILMDYDMREQVADEIAKKMIAHVRHAAQRTASL